ncbi:velvet factor-domain-containing protein [Mycena galopus ATCC 62051]|nr:velvet factor-domain-containing protein [Mycena galopus ATCC 62051]
MLTTSYSRCSPSRTTPPSCTGFKDAVYHRERGQQFVCAQGSDRTGCQYKQRGCKWEPSGGEVQADDGVPYRLKLSLFKVAGNDVRHCKSIYSVPFYVYTSKKFPGVEESSPLTCSLANQGIKIRIRKDISMRKARHPGVGVGVGGGRPLASGASGERAHQFLFWVAPRTKSTMVGAGMGWAALDVCACIWE